MFDKISNFKHDQTRSNSTKQGGQTVQCLVTEQCLMMFGRETFPVWTGLKAFRWVKIMLTTKSRFPCKISSDYEDAVLLYKKTILFIRRQQIKLVGRTQKKHTKFDNIVMLEWLETDHPSCTDELGQTLG